MQSMTTIMETETLEAKPETQVKAPQIITFVAFDPKNQQPVTLRPLQDHTGQLYTGQGKAGYFELLTREEKDNLPFIFDYETKFVVEDGKFLDLGNEYDAALWKWVKPHPYIALKKEEKATNLDAVFYVANAQAEAKERNMKSAKIDEARPAVRKLSQSDQVRIARALGLESASSLHPEQVIDWLLNKCNEAPETVLKAVDPANERRVNAMNSLEDWMKFQVIVREKDGAFYYGGIKEGISLGHTKEMVVDYMLNPENIERVKTMRNRYLEITKQPA